MLQERVKQDYVEFSASQKFAKDQRNSSEVRVQELETSLILIVIEMKNLKNGTVPPALPKHPSNNTIPPLDP